MLRFVVKISFNFNLALEESVFNVFQFKENGAEFTERSSQCFSFLAVGTY